MQLVYWSACPGMLDRRQRSPVNSAWEIVLNCSTISLPAAYTPYYKFRSLLFGE